MAWLFNEKNSFSGFIFEMALKLKIQMMDRITFIYDTRKKFNVDCLTGIVLLWMKRSFMSMKQMNRLEFAMHHAVKTIMDDWVFEKGESLRKSFLVVGIINGRGTILLLQVPASVKTNAKYYVK